VATDGVVSIRVARDGTVESIGEPGTIELAPGGAQFDLTDAVMRAAGMTTYPSRKRALLESTFEARAQMARAHRTEVLRQSLPGLRKRLRLVWKDHSRPAAERRELIFELWDECAEAGSNERVATARSARAIIESFVRRRLPASSQDGFGAQELEGLNRRRTSRARFAPYD